MQFLMLSFIESLHARMTLVKVQGVKKPTFNTRNSGTKGCFFWTPCISEEKMEKALGPQVQAKLLTKEESRPHLARLPGPENCVFLWKHLDISIIFLFFFRDIFDTASLTELNSSLVPTSAYSDSLLTLLLSVNFSLKTLYSFTLFCFAILCLLHEILQILLPFYCFI